MATREAFGTALVALGEKHSDIVVLDAEIANSTYENKFQKTFPDRFFEMFIAEQHMASSAVGLSVLGFSPYLSTFAAFFTRAFDQIRMAQYSRANLKLIGSHAGVSIGQDGPSQMGLEDIAMMKSILNSIIFYPADAVSTYKLVEQMYPIKDISYLRTTRSKTPVLYNNDEQFELGGSKVLHESDQDTAVIFSAGIALHEALKAYNTLRKDGINVAIVDLYSVKPIDETTINRLSEKAKNVIVVEDHYVFGGLGSSVKMVMKKQYGDFFHMAVKKIPHSGSPEELLHYEEIDAESIIQTVKSIK